MKGLNQEQIEKWKEMLSKVIGKGALSFSDKEIHSIRDLFQEKIDNHELLKEYNDVFQEREKTEETVSG